MRASTDVAEAMETLAERLESLAARLSGTDPLEAAN